MKWKNYYSAPGIENFHAPRNTKLDVDCPACRHGTLREIDGKPAFKCIDCGNVISKKNLDTINEFRKLRV
jgi:transposase-like protein